MLDKYYDSYGYVMPEHFVTMAIQKDVKFNPSKTIEEKKTEIESFFSESGQGIGDLNQSPLLMKNKYEEDDPDLGTETITISSAGYATYVTNHALSFQEGVNAYVLDHLVYNSTANAAFAYCNKKASVPANTPILIQAEPGTYEVKIVKSAPSVGTNLFMYSDEGFTVDEAYKYYALTKKNGHIVFGSLGVGLTLTRKPYYMGLDAGIDIGIYNIKTNQNLLGMSPSIEIGDDDVESLEDLI